MAKRKTPAQPDGAPDAPKALQTKSAQDAQRLMASVTAIKPEWHEAGQAISDLYRQERQDGRRGYLMDADAMASVLAGIDAGSTPQQAGMAIGIDHQTISDYIKDGDRDAAVGTYSARRLFSEQCQRARERRRTRLLQRIEAAGEAGPQFWTAPAWLLERGYGQDYKLQQVTGTGGVVVNIGVMAREDVTIGVITPTTGAHNALADVVIPVTPAITST